MDTESVRVMVECPKCHAEQEDFDGFGFIYCQRCQHCTHPSAEGDELDAPDSELMWCTVCGQCVNA